MSIEILPRGRQVVAWTQVRRDSRPGSPRLEVEEEEPGVRIPLKPRTSAPSIDRSTPLLLLVVPAAIFWGREWAFAVGVGVVIVHVGLTLRHVRIGQFRWTHLAFTPRGIAVDGLVVPWSQVEGVVRLEFGGRAGTRDQYLALRIRDFVAVEGLSPFRAGLANLTRRHLVVLFRTTEVNDPEGLARALERLLAFPKDRALLASEAGAQLVRDA